jgi:hypothetical protein
MNPGVSLVENYILQTPKLLLYMDFKFIFKLSTHKNENSSLISFTTHGDHKIKLSQVLQRRAEIPGIKKRF